jgi:hypothetical protein
VVIGAVDDGYPYRRAFERLRARQPPEAAAYDYNMWKIPIHSFLALYHLLSSTLQSLAPRFSCRRRAIVASVHLRFVDKRCLFNCDSPWALTHSRNPDPLQSIHYGDALLSKLEGK